MGIGSSVMPAVDARVVKCMKKLSMNEGEVANLFMKFSVFDRNGVGVMTRNDFFENFVKEKRHYFGDAIFNLIEPKDEEVLTFGEFFEGICIYSLFETEDVLRLCFVIFDNDKTGFVRKDDFKHFIILLHDGDIKSNSKIGMARIESRVTNRGQLSFKDICDLHRTFPSLLFPIYRLQHQFQRASFSESWWNSKKIMLSERHRVKRNLEIAAESAGKVDEYELAKQLMDKEVKEQMGSLKYYMTPWNRVRMQVKIEKRREIEKNLAATLENGDDDVQEEDVEDIQLAIK